MPFYDKSLRFVSTSIHTICQYWRHVCYKITARSCHSCVCVKHHCEPKFPILSADPSTVSHPSTLFPFSSTWYKKMKYLLSRTCSTFSVLHSHPQKALKGFQCQQLFLECCRSQQASLWLLLWDLSHSQVILLPPTLPSDLPPPDPFWNSYSTAELTTVTHW